MKLAKKLAILLLTPLFTGMIVGCSTPESGQAETIKTQSLGGVFEEYTQAKANQALLEGNKVVLFFYKTGDSMCDAVKKDINANIEDIPSDLLILGVDIDNQPEAIAQFGVTSSHTFIMMHDNNRKGPMIMTLNQIIREANKDGGDSGMNHMGGM